VVHHFFGCLGLPPLTFIHAATPPPASSLNYFMHFLPPHLDGLNLSFSFLPISFSPFVVFVFSFFLLFNLQGKPQAMSCVFDSIITPYLRCSSDWFFRVYKIILFSSPSTIWDHRDPPAPFPSPIMEAFPRLCQIFANSLSLDLPNPITQPFTVGRPVHFPRPSNFYPLFPPPVDPVQLGFRSRRSCNSPRQRPAVLFSIRPPCCPLTHLSSF